MSGYSPPLAEMQFAIAELSSVVSALRGPELAEAELVTAVLAEGGKFASSVLDPLNAIGDREGARLENDAVITPPGWRDAYRLFTEAGWNGLIFSERWGGQGMPFLVNAALQEMWAAANMSFGLCPLLTQGAVEAILLHGSEEQKRLYLPKLVSGTWTGTMCLTEAQAGSDLSAVRTRAVRDGKHYRIRGQKLFISYGEHDLTPNIVHLVLARTPDAPEGVKGISLFIVPKFLPDADGEPGGRNDIRCVSLEHKLGIHGSPTAVLVFGDSDGAIGYLVGEENRGLEYMFTMMNMARLSVGLQGVGIAERAYQRALRFARDRVQGRTPDSAERVAILSHPDVRRMLLDMKSRIVAMRALAYRCATALDLADRHADAGERERQRNLAALMIPIAKGWCTESGVRITSTAVQVHGGMGFIEETGAAQYLRDARITTIYEGTTGIQAADLVGRKILRDRGAVAAGLTAEMRASLPLFFAADDPVVQHIGSRVAQGIDAVQRAIAWIIEAGSDNPQRPLAGAVPLLELMGDVLGGYELACSALHARKLSLDDEEPAFLTERISLSHFYANSVLPHADALLENVINGAAAVNDAPRCSS